MWGIVEHGGLPRKIEDHEFQAMLAKDDVQKQKKARRTTEHSPVSPGNMFNIHGKFKRLGDGCHMNLQRDRKKTEKPLAQFCSIDLIKSLFSI